jgi:hypothetical protein
MKKKIFQLGLTIGSIIGLAGINYSLLHSPFVFVVVLVMLAHELGHYFAAKFADADPDLPYFIPFPFFTIGITRVRKMRFISYNSKKKILALGPITGVLTALIFLLLSITFLPQYVLPLSFLIFGEIIFNYIGSDGKKYRHYSSMEQQSCIY